MIGHQPGKNIGRVMINEIKPRFSVARIIAGQVADFQIGQSCRRLAGGQAVSMQ